MVFYHVIFMLISLKVSMMYILNIKISFTVTGAKFTKYIFILADYSINK